MQLFLSVLTSQSFISLAVAMIALGGVILNNCAAEKRRLKDQKAADRRRLEDQEAADRRRRDDQTTADRRRREELEIAEKRHAENLRSAEKLREREIQAAEARHREQLYHARIQHAEELEVEAKRRLEDLEQHEKELHLQLQRDDRARQRQAVAECVGEILKASNAAVNRSVAASLMENSTLERARMVKAVELMDFYVVATNHLALLDLELSEPKVRKYMDELREQLAADRQPLVEAQHQNAQVWVDLSWARQPLSDEALEKISLLTTIARSALLDKP